MIDHPDHTERRRLQQRLVELRNQLDAITGGDFEFGGASRDLSLEEEIAFLERIIAVEIAPTTTWHDRFRASGYAVPDPKTLTDEEIGLEVWQVIQRLSELGGFLHCTNHLSDRELYERLYHDFLAAESIDLPLTPDAACHLDLIGSGSDEDTDCWLRYYADAAERQHWIREFPDYPLPPREDAPHDRDRLLPKRHSPDEAIGRFLDQLHAADWTDPAGAIRVASDLTEAEVKHVPLLRAVRVVLDALQGTGPVRATAKLGNLPRSFVNRVFPLLPYPDDVRQSIEACNKVLNEEDVPLLHTVRLAAQYSGLIRTRKGHLTLTRKGVSLLSPARAGALYRALFLGFFRRVNLAYFDHLPDVPGIQATLAIILWRLGVIARDWLGLAQLEYEVLLPDVREEIEQSQPLQTRPGIYLETRLLRHLEAFGLLEATMTGPDPSDPDVAYRTSPLFHRVLVFAEPEGL